MQTIDDLARSLWESPLRRLLTLTAEERARVLATLDAAKRLAALQSWPLRARAHQLPPIDRAWRRWAFIAGRGVGKTRSAGELVVRAGMHPQVCAGRLALVGRTAADVRDTMIYGESGLMACAERAKITLRHEPSNRRVLWPSGTIATTYSADEPKQLRGPQHGGAWADELSTWPEGGAKVGDVAAWGTLQDSLRLGPKPWTVATMTPRSTETVKKLIKDPATVVTRGSTLDNRANLPPEYIADMLERYEGTRIGRQELYGELLDDMDGALWTPHNVQRSRIRIAPEMARIVIAVDPAVTHGSESDETGIVVAGCDANRPRHGYVLADLSGRYTPNEWAQLVANAYRDWNADRVIAEVNNGGDMVETTLRSVDPDIPYMGIHAKRGKMLRAEPVAALYEQGRVHHVGHFDRLEHQLIQWTPEASWSPDRLDAMVYALTDLVLGGVADETVSPMVYARSA